MIETLPRILISLEIYILLALSLNLISGTTGLLSLCQAAMYGLGAYTSAILIVNTGINFFFTIPFSVAIGLLGSFVIGFFASRLKNLNFSLATLAFQIIAYTIFYNSELTGGNKGLNIAPQHQLFNRIIDTDVEFAVVGSIFVFAAILFFYFLERGHLFKMFECVRDNELKLKSIGKDPAMFKYISIAIASIFSSVAGSLYTASGTLVSAEIFSLEESIFILSIVILGGRGTLQGSLAGATFYIFLPKIIEKIQLPQDMNPDNIRMIVFAIILILVVRFRPEGLFGKK